MITSTVKARGAKLNPADALCKNLGRELCGGVSAIFVYGDRADVAAGVDGVLFYSPLINTILSCEEFYPVFESLFSAGSSVLIHWDKDAKVATVFEGKNGSCTAVTLSDNLLCKLAAIIEESFTWGGVLNNDGSLTCDIKSASPGPNYYTNMLIGNRIGCDRPLQSTPKSVVDRLGRGSFRSHADTQVLATRWDYRPEENGNPANRQFYLVENGKVIFFSGSPENDSVVSAHCTFSQNNTIIEYKTTCGLTIRRTIFILPQYDGLPLATEAQLIEVENSGKKNRDLKIVYIGMFGTPATHALEGDVIYSTVICQSQTLYDENGKLAAVSYDYNPAWDKGNIRFNTLLVHENGKITYPDSFCFKYDELVGSGSLRSPQFADMLPNRHTRKGPGFFAVSAPFGVTAGKKISIDNFTGLVSNVVDESYSPTDTLNKQISSLVSKFSPEGALNKSLGEISEFCKKYSSYLKVSSNDKDFDSYFNHNLPFQVFYQTFVSRSFDQTQKGFREIGFREIQDIFASMYYFAGMGRPDFVKQLITEWASNVYKMGYGNHNFYWKGKEPGVYSDDCLWLVQAVGRYVALTGDTAYLDTEIPMADGGKRKLYDTIDAIITYSSQISVGKHGFPILDAADWNDCLHLDPDCLNGVQKEKAYNEQLERTGGKYGDRFENEFSESIMNAFLLKVAVDLAITFANGKGDSTAAARYTEISKTLGAELVKHTWKGDYFARVLFNRGELEYLGATGDTLATEAGAEGTYFLNSFTWSVLGDVATDEQIGIMLDTLDKNLRTPYGFRLCTGVDYSRIAPKVPVALYFPGDRENGGVFKHANTMAAAAMLKAANTVQDKALAKRLTDTAYWIIDVVLPYKTLSNPFMTCGNPRFCTQYNNYETGENIGPTLSGTSTWLLISLMMAFGIEYRADGLFLSPLMREDDTSLNLMLNIGRASYNVTITKPIGFRRIKDGANITLDGRTHDGSLIPLFDDGKLHTVELAF